MLKNFKRTIFFWIDRLQISRKERITISILCASYIFMMLLNTLIQKKLNYRQENYDAILADFEAKSRALKQKQLEEAMKYELSTEVGKQAGDEPVTSMETLVVAINTAGSEELQKLEGIGKSYAERIIAYRKEHGPFKTKDELLQVKGIGKIRLEKIAPFIKL